MNTLRKIFFYSPENAGKKRTLFRNLHWAVNILALLLWSWGLGLLSLYFAAAGKVYTIPLCISYVRKPLILLLNILPVLMMTLFLWFVSNRAWIAVIGSAVPVLLLTWVNYFKVLLRGDALFATDIKYFSEAADISEGYTLTFSTPMILTVVLVLVCTVAAFFLLKARIRPLGVRIAGAVLVVLVSALLLNTVYFSDKVYKKTDNIPRNEWFLTKWSETDKYICRGMLYPFIHSIKNAADPAPEGYSKDKAAELLAGYEYDDIPGDKKVNIISIMLEAYSDFTRFESINYTNDPYEFFRQLKAESYSGELVTNIFAGGTNDTERAFITGFTKLYEYRTDTYTYATYFKEQGYYVEGAHPGYGWFYNRQNVNSHFGFENYYFLEQKYDEMTKDDEPSDEAFFNFLISQFENRPKDKPYFSFNVSYQNHGPYAGDRLNSNIEYATSDGLSEAGYNILNKYLHGIAKTDRALRTLVEYLRGTDEPVVLLIFGDHKPWLGDGSFVYEELGIDVSRSDDQSYFNCYNTPYLIWANEAAKKAVGNDFMGNGESFSPNFLMNKVFELCSWGGHEFMKASNDLKQYVDVVSSNGVYRENGKLTSELSPQAQDVMQDFLKMQYYWRKER